MNRLFIFILALAIFYSCAGKDGSDGKDGEDCNWDGCGDGSNPIVDVVLNPSGKIETAFCKKGTVIWATSVDAAWSQTGALSGEVKLNDGSYVVRGSFTGPFISYLVPSGTCFNESLGIYSDNVILRGMEHFSATGHNKNYATSLEYYIAEDHFFDVTSPGYDDIPTAFTLAKSEILDYFNFPAMAKGFNDLSVVGDTTADAYLLAFETYITDAGDGPDQYNRIVETALAILAIDLIYRATVRDFVQNIKVKEVTDNIKAERVKLGFPAEVAPLWDLPLYPDYYADIFNGNHQLIEQINSTGSYQCTIDVNDRTDFAYPMEFASLTEAVYYASELKGNQSLWSTTICDNGTTTFICPGTDLLEIEKLRETLLDNSEFNGRIPANDLYNGQYFLVEHYETGTAPSHTCDGEMVPFGKNLATIDGNWNNAIGYNNASRWFVRRPDVDLWN